ncbi:MAG: B12-binding domain-containing radical SAM protein [Deltaproteobacteria bacterium HGW-Deltaproteobacteria-14]|nr:MAG: B12-binding domain-containing radical SAM protein [Deltaproteobacteria bacterium HGW-Deltaproteobacteria-14]
MVGSAGERRRVLAPAVKVDGASVESTRRVVLGELVWTRDKDPRVPLGHASLKAALLRVAGLEVRSVVVAVNGSHDAESVAAMVMTLAAGVPDPDVDVAFGAYVWGEALLRATLKALRRRGFRGRIILGGPQISYCRGGLEGLYPEADGFVRGYGEEALCAIAARGGRPTVQGVHWAGTLDACEQAHVDLERLPSPWLEGLIPLEGQRFVRWETQRGCQFRCSFCQHREAGVRLGRRALATPRIEAEIDLFCRAGVEDIAVLDPVFNTAPHATSVLQRFADHGFRGRLSLQCRAEAIREGFLDAGAGLDLRLELGLQTIHEREGEAIRRKNHLPRVETALAEIRRRGVDHEVSLIFGLPLQTLASFEQSVAWCLERRVPVIKAFPLLILRGTALDHDRGRWGLVDDGGPMGRVVASSTFDTADWLAMARLSEALSQTEGRHPETLEALRRLAGDLTPDLFRWQPTPLRGAA